MTDNQLITCEQLDERLSDWLEHDVDAGTRAALERHAAGCARCRALVADLASIRREAESLPALVPSRDLWPEIEARIQAPVIMLDQSRAARSALRSRWWLGAAAAGLVAVTAGVTYYATIRVDPGPPITAADVAVVRDTDTAGPEGVTAPEATLASETPRSNARVPSGQGATRPSAGSATPSDITEGSEYARDVAQLRAIVTQRRSDLDSSTIAVLEKNLELIDRAIAESRAALRRDPASEFLADQLARAMTKKVAILRTAALLPARS
jgi:putative zinc finger protein